jgi:signal peptidase I
MSLIPPSTEEPSPSSTVTPHSSRTYTEPDGVSSEMGPTEARARGAKRYDYRLRGLDLGAVAAADAPAQQQRPRRPPSRRRRRRRAIEGIVFIAVATLVTVGLRASAVEPFSVTSPSMVPTLQVGYRVLVAKPGVLPRPIRRGDIIVLRHPPGSRCAEGVGGAQDLVKRVIAVPGEKIWSAGDTIYINGRVLPENGWYNPPYGHVGATPVQPTVVPPGEYFVMGDNRTDTCDSRVFGPIPSSLIVGKVVATIMRNGHPYIHLF